jgi:hypothetical protein
MRLSVLLLLLGLALQPATTASLASLYTTQYLQERHDRYEPALRSNFNRLVLGSLTPQERAQIGQVRLELPLRAPGDAAGDPMTFYAKNQSVVIPIQSVKFLDDLSLAWGYAWAKGKSLENVTDYVAMLKYQKPPPGGFPPPLQALGIPGDIWKQDAKIDDVSQKILKSAVVWIMAHEVAHLLYRHPGYGPHVPAKQAQANEAQADHFANEIMRRIGVAPGGMANFFIAMAHWSANRGDFASDEKWQTFLAEQSTHPFTAARMRALAADLRKNPADFSVEATDAQTGAQSVLYIASQIDTVADILEDPQVQRSIAAKAKAITLDSLSYRAKAPAVASGDFSGEFFGVFEHFLPAGDSEELDLALSLTRSGARVTGYFDFGLGAGSIEGFVSGKQLRFEWVWGSAFGQGVLTMEQSNLKGTLGYEGSDSNAGRWQVAPQ